MSRFYLYPGALEDCNLAVKLNPTYVKALVRRAQVHDELGKEEEALKGELLLLK